MNYLTDTERAVLRHILKFDNNKIYRFESLNLDDNARSLLIFDMMVGAFEKGRKLGREEVMLKTKKKSKFWIK